MYTKNLTRYGLVAAAASLSVAALAACGSSNSGSNNAGGGTSGVKTHSSSIGTVSTDTSGRTLYELAGDTTASPKCTGGCLSVWPAAVAGGTQIVLQGHPAYTFSGDSASGQTNGQAVTDQWGTWYALDSNGKPITNATPSSSTKGGGGGYGY